MTSNQTIAADSYAERFLARVASAETESELRDLLNYAETGELAAAVILRGKELEAELNGRQMTVVVDGVWFGKRFSHFAYYRELGRAKGAPVGFGATAAEAVHSLEACR